MTEVNFDSLPIAVQMINSKIDNLLKILNSCEFKNDSDNDSFLNADEAATFLNLSINTIYSKVNKRELPVMKKGKRLYFSKEELSNYLKSGRVKTATQIENDADDYLSNFKKE